MPELGFQNQNQLLSGFRPRDFSPDSVIFTAQSNFSLFSSASCSVDRCSFASDVHDHESVVSEISQHLAGHDFREMLSGPDPDPDRNNSTIDKNSNRSRKVEIPKVHKEDYEAQTQDENQNLDSARSSFSLALKECQDRRSRSEALLKKPDRRRQPSLDLIHVTSSSPRVGVMKKTSVQCHPIGSFPSPGTPNYRHTSVGIQKGWSSERVPSHTNANRKNVNTNTALLPFNNGRALPSKWEDAERWIFSPVSGDNSGVRASFQQVQRRRKSKSGPLGPPGVAYYNMYSPLGPNFEVRNSLLGSPIASGRVIAPPDHLSINCDGGHVGMGDPARTEPCMARSVSVHGCSEQLNQLFATNSQDEKVDNVNEAATDISRAVSRRDMATQMSPKGTPDSSPTRRLSSLSPSTPSKLVSVELHRVNSSRAEVRDVQVDERVTMTRWSKKNWNRFSVKGSENVEDWKRKPVEVEQEEAVAASGWEIAETANNISKVRREEAKITAWENLQKAKAEAAMRKLEMKLEKKRSSSMDKIMKKLKSAQRKAQKMRSSVLSSTSNGNQEIRTYSKVLSLHRTRQSSSLSDCFTCHAF